MDSKSISLDGSRGSSPRPGTNAASSAPDDNVRACTGASADETVLARALLPVLLHELNNHTQYLATVHALESAGDPLPDGGAGLLRTAHDVEELGWLLGLCAGGAGTDLLQARTERTGLAPLVRLVRQALRRAQHDLEDPGRALPDLPSRLGWRGAWTMGELLHAAAREMPERAPLAWSLAAQGDTLVLVCRVLLSPELTDLARRRSVDVASQTDGIRFTIGREPRA